MYLKLTTEKFGFKNGKSFSVPSCASVVPEVVPTFVADKVQERDLLLLVVSVHITLVTLMFGVATRPLVDLLVNVLGIAGGGAPVQFMALKGSEIEGI